MTAILFSLMEKKNHLLILADQQILVRAEVSGGRLSKCDAVNVSRADVVNGTTQVRLQCSQFPNKPFGNLLVLTATFGDAQGRLQVCDVDVKGRHHLGKQKS